MVWEEETAVLTVTTYRWVGSRDLVRGRCRCRYQVQNRSVVGAVLEVVVVFRDFEYSNRDLDSDSGFEPEPEGDTGDVLRTPSLLLSFM